MARIKLKDLITESLKEDHSPEFRSSLNKLDLAANEVIESISDEYGSGDFEMSEDIEQLQELLDSLQETISTIQGH